MFIDARERMALVAAAIGCAGIGLARFYVPALCA
jgi:hypothetical protein